MNKPTDFLKQISEEVYIYLKNKIAVLPEFSYQIVEENSKNSLVFLPDTENNELNYFDQNLVDIKLKIVFTSSGFNFEKQKKTAIEIGQELKNLYALPSALVIFKKINNQNIFLNSTPFLPVNFNFDITSQNYTWDLQLLLQTKKKEE